MRQIKKGNQWYFGAKAHIGLDADSGLVHHVEVTAANVSDQQVIEPLLGGQESPVLADGGYRRQDRVVGNEARSLNRGQTLIWTPHKRADGGELTAHQARCEQSFGADAREGRAYLPNPEMPVWLSEDAVLGPGQEPGSDNPLFMLGNLYQARHRWLASAG